MKALNQAKQQSAEGSKKETKWAATLQAWIQTKWEISKQPEEACKQEAESKQASMQEYNKAKLCKMQTRKQYRIKQACEKETIKR